MAADGKTPPTHPQGGAGTLCVHVVSLCADTKTMTCRPCLDTYIHTYKQTINQYKQIVIIHKSIETYSYTYTWLQMVRPPQPTHRGGAGTLCVHVVSLCADTKTMTCRPCWDTHILTYQQTDRQTHRHTYINQYKHIVIPIHGCICVTYPPFGGGGGGEPGGAGSYILYFFKYLEPKFDPCFDWNFRPFLEGWPSKIESSCGYDMVWLFWVSIRQISGRLHPIGSIYLHLP